MNVKFRTATPDIAALSVEYDLVIATDGVNSPTRPTSRRPSARRWKPGAASTSGSGPTWSSTLSRSTSSIRRPVSCRSTATRSRDASTFVLELHEEVWQLAGFAAIAPDSGIPGQSGEASIEFIRELCADVLGEHQVFANKSTWVQHGPLRHLAS